MLQQILAKSALMFEAQPFCGFVLDIALRACSTIPNAEFSFLLVDQAGVCLTSWAPIAGYEAIKLTRIVFVLSYSCPEFLGIDTSNGRLLLWGCFKDQS